MGTPKLFCGDKFEMLVTDAAILVTYILLANHHSKEVTKITMSNKIRTDFTLPIGLIISSMRTTEHELIEDDVVESVAPKTALIYTPAKPGATVANI